MDPYVELFKIVLPSEIVDYFDLVSVHYSTDPDGRQVAHLHLDEMELEDDERKGLDQTDFITSRSFRTSPSGTRK